MHFFMPNPLVLVSGSNSTICWRIPRSTVYCAQVASHRYVFQVDSKTVLGEFLQHVAEIEPRACTNGFGMKICIFTSVAKSAEVAIC